MAENVMQFPQKKKPPIPGLILLMEGTQGTQVWVNEERTMCHIKYSDGKLAFGLMTLRRARKILDG